MIDFKRLQDDNELVARYQKSSADEAYTVYFGLDQKTGLPLWTISNKTWSLMPHTYEVIESYLDNHRHLQATAVVKNPNSPGLYWYPITYAELRDTQADITTLKGLIEPFQEDFLDFVQKEGGLLYQYDNPPQLILIND